MVGMKEFLLLTMKCFDHESSSWLLPRKPPLATYKRLDLERLCPDVKSFNIYVGFTVRDIPPVTASASSLKCRPKNVGLIYLNPDSMVDEKCFMKLLLCKLLSTCFVNNKLAWPIKLAFSQHLRERTGYYSLGLEIWH